MKSDGRLTVHGSQNIAYFRSSACTNLEVGTGTFVDVDAIVAMISHCEAYKAGRPDLVKCAAGSTVFKRTIDCGADRSVLIPFCEIFSKVKLFPA